MANKPSDPSESHITDLERRYGRTEPINNGRGGWQSWGHQNTYQRDRSYVGDCQNTANRDERESEDRISSSRHPPMTQD